MAVSFVGASVYDGAVGGSSGTIAWPAGTVAGCSATITLFGYNVSALSFAGTGWTNDVPYVFGNATSSSSWGVWSKLSLTSGDIASPPTFSGCSLGGYIVEVESGATGYNFIGVTNAATGAISLAGFTENANSSRITTVTVNNTTTNPTGAPTGFATEVLTPTSFYTGAAAGVASSGYTSGTTITWPATGGAGSAALYEWLTTASSVALTGASLVRSTGQSVSSVAAGLATRGKVLIMGRAPLVARASLVGRGLLMIKCRTGLGASLLIPARAMSSSVNRASLSANVTFTGRNLSISTLKASMTRAASLTGRALTTIGTLAKPSALAPMFATGRTALSGRGIVSAAVEVTTHGIVITTNRGIFHGAVNLSAISRIMTANRGTGVAAADLSAIGRGISTGKGTLATVAGLLATGVGISISSGKAVLNASASLIGREFSKTTLQTNPSALVKLSTTGRSISISRTGLIARASLSSVSRVVSNGQSFFSRSIMLTATGRTLASGRATVIAAVGLSGQVFSTIRSFARLIIAPILDPTRRFVILLSYVSEVLSLRPLQYALSLTSIGYCLLAQRVQGMPFFGQFPSVAPNQKQTISLDFGNFLPSGVTLTGTPTLNWIVKFGSDPTPTSHVTAGPIVGTISPTVGGSGIADTAILFQILGLLPGVTYIVEILCNRSDGDIAEGSAVLSCVSPGSS